MTTNDQSMLSLTEIARLKRAAAQQEQNGGVRPRVLFVDDEERVLRALQALFNIHYELSIATSGARALELLRQSHYHLIVSDQRMPEMTGIEVLREAKEISPLTVRILLTGFADLAAIIGSVNDGEVYRYLSKPWDNQDLQHTISEAAQLGIELAGASDKPAAPSLEELSALLSDLATVLFLEDDGQTHASLLADKREDFATVHARTPDEAIDMMQQQEIRALVVAIDGKNSSNIEFLYWLKKEHPHLVSVILTEQADSEVVIRLINDVRAHRVAFRPVKIPLLRVFIRSALKKAEEFLHHPAFVKTQQGAASPAGEAVIQRNPGFGERLLAIKNFFRRAMR